MSYQRKRFYTLGNKLTCSLAEKDKVRRGIQTRALDFDLKFWENILICLFAKSLMGGLKPLSRM